MGLIRHYTIVLKHLYVKSKAYASFRKLRYD